MNTVRLLFILLAILGHTVAPVSATAQSQAPGEPTSTTVGPIAATIRPGDAVQISVWRKPELSGEFYVAGDGSISHPLYQDVKIAGVTPEVAAQRVQEFLLQTETNPRVRIDPIYRVSVGGEVRIPRLYNLRPEHTVSDAVHEAGGPTERGRVGRLRLYRNGEVHKLELDGADASAAEVLVQSGDRIIIERRMNVLLDVVRPTVSFIGSIASITYAWRRIRR
jgi:polysaccharide biosynthesis/export protein